jgi:hypothetical protein
LKAEGFAEDEILDMQLDKFYLYVEAVIRKEFAERKVVVSDLVASIGIALSGKGLKEYLDQLKLDKDGY